MHAIFATYLQNVTTLPCKMANNVRAHLEFCKSRAKHSDKHVHKIVNCVEQLTNKMRLVRTPGPPLLDQPLNTNEQGRQLSSSREHTVFSHRDKTTTTLALSLLRSGFYIKTFSCCSIFLSSDRTGSVRVQRSRKCHPADNQLLH